ncbi:vacuolar protein-sorting-associated protein 36-like [Hydractinia symbiolongicarpus]|uniref:vacuolar protein-sorting-associated protein 36-like n=1 Tax=Hydractinia symbiolongicarpus TaxID=13093 RepID=UPI00254AE5BD|nr:vacuolar protein-sorting-associated protein 36-like [Hydractinia symbiolongicarpus]
MDRFYWFNGQCDVNERQLHHQLSVRLYDGDEKTTFDSGLVNLTNLKLIWKDEEQKDRVIAINLDLIKKIEFEGSSMFKSAKITLHLQQAPPDKPSGPKRASSHNYIRLSFRVGGQEAFGKALQNALSQKDWEKIAAAACAPSQPQAPQISHRHVGIGGIERKMQEKYKKTDESINQAFKDLDALIDKAKDMVVLAEKFSSKLQDKKISITDDETVAFKSYLLSMGIDNPVTRDTHGSGVRYHEELAKQLASFLNNIIEDEGGVMTLTDVYCRFNRARGMELISPDDVYNAAKMFEGLRLPMRLRKFDSGVLVIQSLAHTEEEIISKTTKKVIEEGSLTAEELGGILGLAFTLAKERLLLSEKFGKLCRDDSVEGLRFYPNKFLDAGV